MIKQGQERRLGARTKEDREGKKDLQGGEKPLRKK